MEEVDIVAFNEEAVAKVDIVAVNEKEIMVRVRLRQDHSVAPTSHRSVNLLICPRRRIFSPPDQLEFNAKRDTLESL